jgi:hypothetical protein
MSFNSLGVSIKFGVILRMRCQKLSPINLFSDIFDIFASGSGEKGFYEDLFSPNGCRERCVSEREKKNKLKTRVDTSTVC